MTSDGIARWLETCPDERLTELVARRLGRLPRLPSSFDELGALLSQVASCEPALHQLDRTAVQVVALVAEGGGRVTVSELAGRLQRPDAQVSEALERAGRLALAWPDGPGWRTPGGHLGAPARRPRPGRRAAPRPQAGPARADRGRPGRPRDLRRRGGGRGGPAGRWARTGRRRRRATAAAVERRAGPDRWGLVDRLRQLTPDERLLLQEAVLRGGPVELDYVDASGMPTTRVVEQLVDTGHLLEGWCRLRADERVFAPAGIVSVRSVVP